MITTSPASHVPQVNGSPAQRTVLTSPVSLRQVSGRRLTSCAPFGWTRLAPVPGQTAIEGRTGLVRHFEGVLRSSGFNLAQVGDKSDCLRTDRHVNVCLDKATVAAHFNDRESQTDFMGQRLVIFNSVCGCDGHVIAPLCFLTYGNKCGNSSVKLPKGRKK